MLVGVGEASFVALAAPFIGDPLCFKPDLWLELQLPHFCKAEASSLYSADDNAPAGSKTKWLAIFYLCIPTGYALGYILGGVLAGPLTWRGLFVLEAALMVPFVLFCCFASPIDIKGTKTGWHALLACHS